jgi:diguanylate cyclase (GGDEF)-like protein
MPKPESNAALNPKALPYLWSGVCLYLAAHLLVNRFGTHDYLGAFMVIALGLMRIACCVWWFVRLPALPARYRWLSFACGAILANTSTQIYTWRAVFVSKPDYLSGPASLFASLAGIPILLSIASDFNRKDSPVIRWIDLAIGLTLGSLFTAQLLFPAGAQSASAVASILSVNRLIDFEDAFLLICAALQFLSSDGVEDRRYAYVFFFYMGVTAPLLAVRNRLAASHPSLIWDFALDILPLVFILLALNPMPRWVRDFRASDRVVHLVRGGSPLFMSLALTLLGIGVSGSHFYLGTAGVLLGIIGYGLRNAVIHGKLLQTEERLVSAHMALELEASRDSLTGIPNRRVFDQTLSREWRSATRNGAPLAVLMIDIDLFKGLNDAYGHQRGDECLIAVARAIQELLPRSGDLVGRYGGEEFAVILPGTSIAGAQAVAERLRFGIVQLAISNPGSQYGCVTISIGVAVADAASVPDLTSLLRAADEALYRAKRTGRNRSESVELTIPIAPSSD